MDEQFLLTAIFLVPVIITLCMIFWEKRCPKCKRWFALHRIYIQGMDIYRVITECKYCKYEKIKDRLYYEL